MTSLESALRFPFGHRPSDSVDPIEVADGVWWVRLPLPFALDHINVWLLRDELDGEEGWTVVDTGVATSATTTIWERLFDKFFNGLPVLRVIVTHGHPDHIGLADWICAGGSARRWNASLWVSFGEYMFAQFLASGAASTAGGPQASSFFELHGLGDQTVLEEIRTRGSYYPRLVPSIPRSFRRVFGGETLCIGQREWMAVTGFGHSPEHIALFCERNQILISGDMVLPRISTNVSVTANEPDGDPLSRFLQSLDCYESMGAETLVLPAHGSPFQGLQTRINQLREHHAARLLDVVQTAQAHPVTAADLLPILFRRSLDSHQMTFAMGESIAHLNLLWRQQRLVRHLGKDGIIRFHLGHDRNEMAS
jgi:glyoxylase-like metal-dependent hydrolase (beta-lactamase superfamily II)